MSSPAAILTELALNDKKCYIDQLMKVAPAPVEEIPNIHWADHVALDLIAAHPDKDTIVCASGISPSGVVHIGNFREVITVEFVVRALRERGKKVRFIYSWDDYDALRKVPANLPNQELIEANLRKPISRIPDPFGKYPSYAAHFEGEFERGLKELDIAPEYLRQNEAYRRGDYQEGIRTALENEKTIRECLDQHRTEALPPEWTCITIYCSQCGRDATTNLKYFPPTRFSYRCKPCKLDLETDFAKPESGVKLLWRIDWPMRWAREGVDFEPGGKDHSAPGGSYETGKQIIKKVWKKEAPAYLRYDFVLAKGLGSKLSSSSGSLITLDEAMAVYEPSIVRWIFASRKPNIDFSIAFDLDVLKAYDDFDRTARIALGMEEAEEKKQKYERRIYELSRTPDYPEVTQGARLGQFPLRHLCNMLQIHEGNIDAAAEHYRSEIKDKGDETRFRMRAERAWFWIQNFAPEDFRFSIRGENSQPEKSKFPKALSALVEELEKPGFSSRSEDDIAKGIFAIMKGNGIEPKLFFQDVYGILVGKPSGPKLASFLLVLGAKRSANLLKRAL